MNNREVFFVVAQEGILAIVRQRLRTRLKPLVRAQARIEAVQPAKAGDRVTNNAPAR
jgi:hypothetical protein